MRAKTGSIASFPFRLCSFSFQGVCPPFTPPFALRRGTGENKGKPTDTFSLLSFFTVSRCGLLCIRYIKYKLRLSPPPPPFHAYFSKSFFFLCLLQNRFCVFFLFLQNFLPLPRAAASQSSTRSCLGGGRGAEVCRAGFLFAVLIFRLGQRKNQGKKNHRRPWGALGWRGGGAQSLSGGGRGRKEAGRGHHV